MDATRMAVAPDGSWIAYVLSEAETRSNLYVRAVADDDGPRPFRTSRADETYPTFSPDGRWLCYQSDETGRPEIYVEAFPGPGERFPITADGGAQPLWSRGSGEIFYRHHDEFRVIETSLEGGRFEFAPSRALFSRTSIDRGESVQARTYDVTSDGDRILAVSIPAADLPRRVEFITGWTVELEGLEAE